MLGGNCRLFEILKMWQEAIILCRMMMSPEFLVNKNSVTAGTGQVAIRVKTTEFLATEGL